jgi:hypothetical protein
MKISYARLRSGVNYKGPLRNIIDSFCELHKMFIERNPKYKVEDFPSMYTSAVNIYPQVSSEEMALALYSAGVFEDNTIVQLPDGTTRRLIP